MPLDNTSLLPVVVGTEINDNSSEPEQKAPIGALRLKKSLRLVPSSQTNVEVAQWWVQLDRAGAQKIHGPLLEKDVVELIDIGDVKSDSLLWKHPWNSWERVNRSQQLVWVYERAELFALETPDFDIDLEADLFDEPMCSAWQSITEGIAMSEERAQLAHVIPFKCERKAVGVRRKDYVGGFMQIAALTLLVFAGVLGWFMQVPGADIS